MNNRFLSNAKRLLSGVLAASMAVTTLPAIPAMAEDAVEKYPYTLFAGSSEEGSITINADNFCVNGNVATNGTIVSSENMNINGTKTENANKDMIYIFDKIDSQYFSSNNIDEHTEDYTLEEINININTPTEVQGEATLTGNINIDTAFKALENVNLYGEVKNTNNSLIYSKYGDIIIDSQNVNLNGLVYAPFGDVEITAQNLNLNNVVIIADSITFNCPSVNANYSSSVAEFAGNISEPLNIPYEEWQYMKDENENDFPDFFEDYDNWTKLIDTDDDGLPDCVEIFVGTDLNIVDTDGDSLPDGYEMLTSLTDPTIFDSYENGVSDGECDIDSDGLLNYQEYVAGTNPYNNDSDWDGLKDGDELNVYATDPLNPDSDYDGINDGDEITLGTNPLTVDSNGANSFTKTFTPDMFDIVYNEYYPEVIFTSDAKGITSFNMDLYVNDLNYNSNVPGYIDMAFEFTAEGEFGSAELKFHIPDELLSEDDFEPAIYYYNEEEKRLEEVANQSISGNIITTRLEHFSVYTVLNKRAFNAKYNEVNTYYSYMPLDDDLLNDNTSDADIMFVLDDSGSMRYNDPNNGRKSATSQFVEKLTENDRIGLIKFTTSATILSHLGYAVDTAKTALINNLDRLYNNGGTDGSTGLNAALNQLDSDSRAKCVIFLTDGVDTQTRYSYNSIIERAKENGITIFTIGLGSDVNGSLLDNIATSTYGKYFSIDDTSELYDCFLEIKELTIDYVVDSNNDGISDYNTWKLCSGQYLDGTGQHVFPFGFPVDGDDFKTAAENLYNEVQANDDFDGDGVVNGKEVYITTYQAFKYAHIVSYANESDSDFDGYSDYDEINTYKTNPLDYTVMVNENQLNHLTLSDYYIASIYKDQVLGGNVANDIGIWIGNTIYSRNIKSDLYVSEVVNILDVLENSKTTSSNYYDIMQDVLNASLLCEASVGGKCISDLYKSFDVTKYADAQKAYIACEKLKNGVTSCENIDEIKNYMKGFTQTTEYYNLTDSIYLKSSIISNINKNVEFFTGADAIIKFILSGKKGVDSYFTYSNLYYTSVLFEDSISILESTKNSTEDSELICAINKILPIMKTEFTSQDAAIVNAIETFGFELLYNDLHFAIGVSGPVGTTVEIALGLGNLAGISKASEYAIRTCCAASMADALADNWYTTVKNNPETYNKNRWYAENGLNSSYASADMINDYYWYLVNIRSLANDDFITLQTAGKLPNLGWITNKTNIELADQNAEWLTYDYLLRNYLLI